MNKERQKLIISVVWCGAIACIAFLFNLGSIGLIDDTEPLFAEAARTMKVTGDWVTPYFNGETRFDKPPLIYWGMVMGFQLIGVNEWAVRLPSAIAGIALTFFCFYAVSHFAKRGAWLVPGILGFNFQTIIWGRTGLSDMLLSGCVGIALLCFFWGYTQGDDKKVNRNFWQFPSPWYLAFYILLALAVLTKGPVGMVLPVLIILAFLIYIGQLKPVIQEIGIVWGGIIFLLLSVPWFVLIILRHGDDYINNFFGYHNLERFTNVVNGHWGPWYFYFPFLFVLFAPWSIYLPVAIARVQFWRRRFWRQQPRSQQLSIFAFFWLVTIFCFFSASVTKLPSYMLPIIPAATILVSLFWGEVKPSTSLLISIIINIIFVFILAIAFWYIPNLIGEDPSAPNLPQMIAESGLPLRGTIIWGLTGIALIFFLRQKQQWRWIIWTNLVGFIACFLLVLTPAMLLVDELRQLPLRQLSAKVIEVQKPQEEVFVLGFKTPSVVFYTQTQISFFRVPSKLKNYIKESLEKHPTCDTVLVITPPKRLDKFNINPKDYQLIEQRGIYLLFRIPRAKLL